MSGPGRVGLGQDLAMDVRVQEFRHETAPRAFAENAHDELEVSWAELGAVGYRSGRREIVVSAGGAIVVPPGVAHATSFFRGLRATSVKIDRRVAEGVAAAMGARV